VRTVTGAGPTGRTASDHPTTSDRSGVGRRPADVRVAFATTTPEVLDGADLDRIFHDRAFARAGMTLDHRVWWDPEVEWKQYDLVVIRSPWDYLERLGEFREWLDCIDGLGTLHNPAGLVRWNLDKRYLLELEHRGVPVIPTRVATSESEAAHLIGSARGEVVVKPGVSAGGRNTGRFAAGDGRASALARRILAEGTEVMIQPSIRSVATEGEWGAVLFDGVVSHSFARGAILGPDGSHLGADHLDRVSPRPLDRRQQQVVEEAMAVVTQLGAERFGLTRPPLYTRLDLVTLDDGRAAVLEVELTEPSFFLSVDPAAADRFAAAVLARLQDAAA
jgi:glutathione synthase/RimK-type ligase-like ATP-grasp enzyme